MIVTKPGDSRLVKLTRELSLYLINAPRYGKDHGVTVYVDKQLKDVKRFGYESLLRESPYAKDKLKFWTAELCAARPEIFNFVLTVSFLLFFVATMICVRLNASNVLIFTSLVVTVRCFIHLGSSNAWFHQ